MKCPLSTKGDAPGSEPMYFTLILVSIRKRFGERQKEWATYLLTTENTEFTEIFKSFLRAQSVCALRGEVSWQAHQIGHSHVSGKYFKMVLE
jgi:hypothetical protein